MPKREFYTGPAVTKMFSGGTIARDRQNFKQLKTFCSFNLDEDPYSVLYGKMETACIRPFISLVGICSAFW